MNLASLSRSELESLVLSQAEQISSQAEQISRLEEKLNRLLRNSTNSSKPPSSDMFDEGSKKRRKLKSQRQRTGLKPGGQFGRKGVTKNQFDNPNKVESRYPDNCQSCGKSLAEEPEVELISKRQEIDIPPITPFVTEYRQYQVICSCGQSNKGEYPANIKDPMQIGKKMQSLLVYLNVNQLIPYDRLTKLCEDLLNFPLCTRTVENALERAHQKALPLYGDIMQILKSSSWVGSDETGKRVSGERIWEWVWQNDKANYYHTSQSRWYKVVKEEFGEDYQGILLHDCWSAQNNTVAKNHQQCHYHLQRDLIYLIETHKNPWAYATYQLLLASQKAKERIYQEGFDPKIRQAVISCYNNKLRLLNNMPQDNKEAKTLQKRFVKHQDSILTFLNNEDLPCENNSSERAVRMTKVKQKISGGYRSMNGAQRHSVLLSIIETAKKQGMNVLEAIEKLFCGELRFE